MRRPVPSRPSLSPQNWSTFVRNHARETLACDFFVAVTATFRLVYVFLVLDIGTRRLLHWNVTEHPTAEWTAQQFRSVLTGDEPYRFVVHDRDAVFAAAVDDALRSMHLRVLKTTRPRPASERVLRATDRNGASRMSRPPHSTQRAASAEDPGRVGPALQSGSPAREPRSWDSGAVRADRVADG